MEILGVNCCPSGYPNVSEDNYDFNKQTAFVLMVKKVETCLISCEKSHYYFYLFDKRYLKVIPDNLDYLLRIRITETTIIQLLSWIFHEIYQQFP